MRRVDFSTGAPRLPWGRSKTSVGVCELIPGVDRTARNEDRSRTGILWDLYFGLIEMHCLATPPSPG